MIRIPRCVFPFLRLPVLLLAACSPSAAAPDLIAVGHVWTGDSANPAAQAVAVTRELALDPAKVNPLGGAIALGHPLGATGAIRTATLLAAMQREPKLRYGLISMCVGTGMGAAGVFERV